MNIAYHLDFAIKSCSKAFFLPILSQCPLCVCFQAFVAFSSYLQQSVLLTSLLFSHFHPVSQLPPPPKNLSYYTPFLRCDILPRTLPPISFLASRSVRPSPFLLSSFLNSQLSPSLDPTFYLASIIEINPAASCKPHFPPFLTLCLPLAAHISCRCYSFLFASFCLLSYLVCYLPCSLPGAESYCALQSPWLRAVDHREACVSERLMDGL